MVAFGIVTLLYFLILNFFFKFYIFRSSKNPEEGKKQGKENKESVPHPHFITDTEVLFTQKLFTKIKCSLSRGKNFCLRYL